MSILFASLDESITSITEALITVCPDIPAASKVKSIANMRFDEKRKLTKRVFREAGLSNGNVDVALIIDCLHQTKAIAKDRNHATHGWLRWDDDLKKPIFRDNRGADLSASLAELNRINAEIDPVWEQFVRESLAFIRIVLSHRQT